MRGFITTHQWKILSLLFVLLTLATWFDARVEISFRKDSTQAPLSKNDLTQAVGSISSKVNEIKSASSSAEASARPKIPAINFTEALGIPAYSKPSSPQTTITDILQTKEALALNESFITKEGFKTPYGLTLGLDTYTTIKNWNKEISLAGDQAARAEELFNEIYHPCCDSMINLKSCGCGHAVGMSGLVKKMIQDGRSKDEIKREMTSWAKYFWPKHYVIMALLQQKLGKSLDEIDASQRFASISAQRVATEYLVNNWNTKVASN